MNSSREPRVLDEVGPDSNQSARERQPILNRPKLGPQASRRHLSLLPTLSKHPVTSSKPIYDETLSRFVTSRPARLALKLEAPLGQFTIFSNVVRNPTPVCLGPAVEDSAARGTRVFRL